MQQKKFIKEFGSDMETLPEQNSTPQRVRWEKYYEMVKNDRHSKTLEYGLEHYSPNNDYALDIGAGTLRDTKYLLEKGFAVTAIDYHPDSMKMAEELGDSRLEFFGDYAGNYTFSKDHFSVVNAQGFLFHFEKRRLLFLIEKIKESLKKGGILCANFIGENHDWNYEGTSKTIVNKKQLEEILEGFEIVFCEDYEMDESEEDIRIKGKEKPTHWHIINVIARKK